MPIILDNTIWMIWNVALAFVGYGFGWLFFTTKNRLLLVVYGVCWVLFVPNTIYLITDLFHLADQWSLVGKAGQYILVLQYGILTVLGFYTYVWAVRIFEKRFQLVWHSLQKKFHFFKKIDTWMLMGVFNFAFAFAVGMGRTQRTNSWEMASNPVRVVRDIVSVASQYELMICVILFGIGMNVFYFCVREEK
jgi:uncharacterized membrane protein